MNNEFVTALDSYAKASAKQDWGTAQYQIERAIEACPSALLLPQLSSFRSHSIKMHNQSVWRSVIDRITLRGQWKKN